MLFLEKKTYLAREILLFHHRDWKRLSCIIYSTQWKDKSSDASMLRKATLTFFPPWNLLHVLEDKPTFYLLLSEHWFHTCCFHPMKGTAHRISFEEKPIIAGEFLLFHIRESISDLVNILRVKENLHKHHNPELLSFLVPLYHHIRECTLAPLWHCSGNQPLLFAQLDFSYT